MEEQTALLDEWPRISFEEIGKEMDGEIREPLYKLFFALLHLPKIMLSPFIEIFKEEQTR